MIEAYANNNPEFFNYMNYIKDIRSILHNYIFSSTFNILTLKELISLNNGNYNPFEVEYNMEDMSFNIKINKTVLKKIKKDNHATDSVQLSGCVIGLFLYSIMKFLEMKKDEIVNYIKQIPDTNTSNMVLYSFKIKNLQKSFVTPYCLA